MTILATYVLSKSDRANVRDLLNEIAGDPNNLNEAVFLDKAAVMAQALPLPIREAFYEFKLRERSPLLLVTNNPVLPSDVGPTPDAHWLPGQARSLNLPQLMHGLYASLLGEPFGFETQQHGRVFNDLISIEGQPPNSSSGAGPIGLHTEDCVHPFMPDYLGLLCLRNDTRAETLVSSLIDVDIPEDVRQILFRNAFGNLGSRVRTRSILFGDPARPYLRYGSVDRVSCDHAMNRALRSLSDALEKRRQSIALLQGDCLYVDNFLAVHGRAAYEARYGAASRWFCRLVMVRDLRRTRAFRASPDSRVMLGHTY
jgi:L-asparagine oxygenase